MKKEDSFAEIEKSKSHFISEIIEYLPNAIVTKTTIKKTSSNAPASSIDEGKKYAEKKTRFDTYIQITEDNVKISIKKKLFVPKLGDRKIIPAHTKHHFNANEQFKMISTVIKRKNED